MNKIVRLLVDRIKTPLGDFAVVVDAEGRLRAAGFTEGHARMERQLRDYASEPGISLTTTADPGGVTTAIAAYFAGDRTAIDAIPVATAGTEFQATVWRALREIPYGETWSYGDLARRIGRPSAVRAVGLANGANPVALVVPCHRVIGSTGKLTGYGGGLDRKSWLLSHELPRSQGDAIPLAWT